MPGGERSTAAGNHTGLFAETVASFGWVLLTHRDKNLPCSVCKPTKGGKVKEHGVDLLFKIQCPYVDRARGIYVDGKRYALTSVTSKEQVKGWLESARTFTRHLDQSQGMFREKLELPDEMQIDTGIVAWDCHEGWDRQIAFERRGEVVFSGSDQPPLTLLFLLKNHLDRLTTVKNFSEKCSHFEFLYKTKRAFVWTPVLAPELLMSTWWPVRYKLGRAEHWDHALIVFDLDDSKSVRFSVPILNFLGLTTHASIDLFLAGLAVGEVGECQVHLDSTAKEYSLTTRLTCKNFPTVEYKS